MTPSTPTRKRKKSTAPITEISSANGSAVVVPQFEPILTVEQAAEILQLNPSTIYELTRRRNARPLPVHKAGKFLRFRRSEIERWLDGKAA
jgi:excisionase family DNA binding protein